MKAGQTTFIVTAKVGKVGVIINGRSTEGYDAAIEVESELAVDYGNKDTIAVPHPETIGQDIIGQVTIFRDKDRRAG